MRNDKPSCGTLINLFKYLLYDPKKGYCTKFLYDRLTSLYPNHKLHEIFDKEFFDKYSLEGIEVFPGGGSG